MTAPVSSRETGIRLDVRTPSDLCDFVDQMDGAAVGELVVRGPSREVRGIVFIEDRRVCWAAARGLARRLTELLLGRAPGISADAMEELFRRCKQEGTPLGELLVARGVVAPDDLRAALLEHTAESLGVLLSPGDAEVGWCVRPGPGYSARFTFHTAEVLARTARRSMSREEQVLAGEIDTALESAFGRGGWGAAFIRGSGAAPVPVAVFGELPATTRDVLRVGKWAASALDLASTFQDADALVSADAPGSDSVFVAWRLGLDSPGLDSPLPAIVAGRTCAQGPGRILNQRANGRLRTGVNHGGLRS